MPVTMEAALLSSTIESVHVHRDGAIVTRAIAVPAQAGVRVARVSGLPLLLDDATIRLSVHGPAVAVDLRVALESASVTDDHPDDQERLRLAAEVARLENVLTHVDRVRAMVERTSVYRRPQPQDATPPIEVDVAARLALLDFRVAEMDRLANERAGIARDLERAQSALAAFMERVRRREGERAPRPDELKKAAVFTLRSEGDPAPLRMRLSYAIAGARWAPAYALHVDSKGSQARLEVRAVVSQATGEDWRNVALALSSAPLMRPCDLPELASLRIGRAQAAPKKTWRRPPADIGTLFEDYRRTLARAPGGGPPPQAAPPIHASTITHDEATPTQLRREDLGAVAFAPPGAMPAGMGGFGGPPQAAPQMAMPATVATPIPGAAMPMRSAPAAPPMARAKRAPMMASLSLSTADDRTVRPGAGSAVEIVPDERLFSFGDLRLPPPATSGGRLTIARREDLYLEASSTLDARVATKVAHAISAAAAQMRGDLASRPLPMRHVPPTTHDGFDAVYDASAPVDIPSDGDFHAVALLSSGGPCTISYVTVPRETSDVFRRADVVSPLDVPLLPGPCDVYTDGSFLLATDLEVVPPRGKVSLGLGVDQAIKVARNVWHSEQTAGLMGGSLVLKHVIKVELVSHKAHAVSVEVRERIPVPAENEEDVRVEVLETKPSWSAWEPPPSEPPLKGGHAWRVKLEPKAKVELEASYAVRIPAKLELVGGNRRD